MKGRGILFNKNGIDESKCIDIFLSTLPYSILIKPFKLDNKLQKKLAGFRLNEKSSPLKKIIPILRQEILNNNFKYDNFIKEWIILHKDVQKKLSNMGVKEIESNLQNLCTEYGTKLIISGLLIDNRENIINIINDAIELDINENSKKSEPKDVQNNDSIDKKYLKLEKEIEKLQDKLIKEEKKNIIEVENLKRVIEHKDNEILSLNKKVDDLEQEKRRLEMTLQHIGLEFEKHVSKLIKDSVSKERNNENLKVSIYKLFMDLKQENHEIKSYLVELKESLNKISEEIKLIDKHVSNEQSAVSLEANDYSLLDDLSKMLKNS
ncbi:hypothetical protein SAMN05660242_2275 [Thermoanaerobacterium sp. RBIITD]|nr:hypothetical protein SAMN05660242_2275 [Thermoanaerobacterium sp. RBIITD]